MKKMRLSAVEISVVLSLMLCFRCMGQSITAPGTVISLGLPYLSEKKINQDLFIKDGNIKISFITITCFDVTKEQDSTQVYTIKAQGIKSKRKEVFYTTLRLNGKDNKATLQAQYQKILLKNKNLPAGTYHTYLTLQLKDSSIITKTFLQEVDSELSENTAAHKQFDNTYNPPKKRTLLSRVKAPSGASNTRTAVKKYSGKINKGFNEKGFSVSYRETPAITFADVYCQDKYVGYYQIKKDEPLADNIEKRKSQLAGNITTGVDPKLGNNKPVFSQVKELYSERKKNEVTGNISLTGNQATSQEEYSENDNNYYEIASQVEMPVMGIPVTLEGYYTTQDAHRTVKSSYIRLHYDSDQAKSGLLQLISGYNSKYDEASAKGKGMESIYGTYLGKLKAQQDKLWAEIIAETGVTDIGKFKADTTGLLKEMTASYEKNIDSATQTATKKDVVTRRYNKAMNKYRQMQEIENKSQRYRTLLGQYRSNNYFDSVLVYNKLKNINKGTLEDKSYKQLAKSADGLLPEGETKKFITGLTSLDAGIFSKRISTYTLDGQTIKGIDAAYDFGFCETGITYGNVEYVGRDGQLDRYSGYSGRASFKPWEKQKVTLVYYGYMPSKRMLSGNDFFNKVDAYMPNFKAPIHILSAVYSGAATKHTDIEAEAATSFRNKDEFQKKGLKTTDKMAYRLNVEESIPQTTVNVRGGYEHIGKQFENNTLPMNLSGTEKYTAGADAAFFNNFLSLGIEYNYLIQQNFASKSGSSKWGFEVKATSKRYPSASLSYKPFTTFRSVTDTFNTPQRPIFGEVWLGKLSYQFKNRNYTLRLTAIYNKNTASVDTTETGSNIAQLNAIYTRGKISLMLNAGQTQMKVKQLLPVHNKTKFVTIAAAYTINSQWSVNAGQDIGMMKTGLSRYGASIGGGYNFKKLPLSLRANFRYNTYRLSEAQAWKTVYAGMLNMDWRFKFKMKDKI